jgi:large subunit ribosomal protein L3
MGGEKKTVLNLQIVKIEMESNHIFLRGAIPGANGGLLRIKKTNRK